MVYVRNRQRSMRRGRGRGFSTNRRPTVWVRNYIQSPPDSVQYGARLVTAQDLDPGARVGSTVVRIHGQFMHITTGVDAQIAHYLGIAILPESTIEVDTVPEVLPWTDRNAVQWLYWMKFYIAGDNRFGTVVGATGEVMTVHSFDVKAKRRFYAPSDNLIAIVQRDPNFGAAQGRVFGVTSSVLLKLS